MFGLKGQELLIILVIVLLVFGARKLPELARSLGSSAKEFRKGIAEGNETVDETQAAEAQASEVPTENPTPDTQKPDS
jgi:sec-independent protein translocase protein TatA